MNALVQRLADGYFAEAARWDADRIAAVERTRIVAWGVAAAGWVCALGCSCALALLLPLKRVDPFVIRVDNSTGIVDVVPVLAGAASMDETVSRYFLSHYVTICERFTSVTAESDYQECGAFHSAQRNQVWYALWKTSNPDSPLNLYRDGSRVHVDVQSISFFKRANGVSDLAQVRYLKTIQQSAGALPRATRWIATIQYAYAPPSKDLKLRTWNPLGFKILDFNAEPEVAVEVPVEAAHAGTESRP